MISSFPGTSQETLNPNWQTDTGTRTYEYKTIGPQAHHACKFDDGWDGTWYLQVDTEYCVKRVEVQWVVNGIFTEDFGPRAIGVTIEGYDEESTAYVTGTNGWVQHFAPAPLGPTSVYFNPPRRVTAGSRIALRMIDPDGFDYCYFGYVKLQVCDY